MCPSLIDVYIFAQSPYMPDVCRLRAQNGSPYPTTSQPTVKDQGVPGVGGAGVAGEEEGRSLYSVLTLCGGNLLGTKLSQKGAWGDKTDKRTICRQCSCTLSNGRVLKWKIYL
jgi:hypothetical protein